MADEMLDLARANAAKAEVNNVEFVKGHIEQIPLPDDAANVIISNCVINLATDKSAVLAEMFRVLAPDGRIGVSDVVAGNQLDPAQRAERGSYVGCIAGALSEQEYRDGLAAVGFTDVSVIFTHEAVPEMHGATVRATKPARPTPTLLPPRSRNTGAGVGHPGKCWPVREGCPGGISSRSTYSELGVAVGSAWARVGIEAGDGLVARFGDVVILIAAGTTAEDAAAVDLLEALATAETPPGAAVAASLAGILTGRPPAEIPAFGVVAPVDGGLVVLLRGAVTAEAVGQDTVHRLSGWQALTWVDRVIELPVERIMLTCSAGRATAPHPRSDLREGVVPGRGFLVTVGSEAAANDAGPSPGTNAAPSTFQDDIDAAPAPDAVGAAGDSAEGPPTNGRDESGSAATASSDARSAEPPVKPPPEPSTKPSMKPPTSTESTVQAPDRPHPTAPRTAPAHETMVTKAPLGALVADGGSPRILLDRAYVIGRDPHNDPAVRGATASPIVLHDPDNLISRVHVYVSVDGGELILRDAGSATGTYIAAPGAEDWTAIGAEPTSLPPGWSVRLGKRIFTFVAMGTQPRQP